MVVLSENQEICENLIKNQEIISSCSICLVSFVTQDQLNQHLLYHTSNECYNFWLQKLPSNDFEGEKLDPIMEPSENDEFRPTSENSIPRSHAADKAWHLDWDNWNANAEKPAEKLEILPSCTICGKGIRFQVPVFRILHLQRFLKFQLFLP